MSVNHASFPLSVEHGRQDKPTNKIDKADQNRPHQRQRKCVIFLVHPQQ